MLNKTRMIESLLRNFLSASMLKKLHLSTFVLQYIYFLKLLNQDTSYVLWISYLNFSTFSFFW